MANSKGRNAKDYVKDDGVIKELVIVEDLARNAWEGKWGFARHYDKFRSEAAREVGVGDEEFRKIVEKHRKRGGNEVAFDWEVAPSGGVPRTSSGFVGWRGARPECNLEKLGPLYVSPKNTLEPPDGEENFDKHFGRTCIFLG